MIRPYAVITLAQTITLVCCVLSPLTVHAHKLNLFAFVEGNQISVEAYFPDGKKARNSEVQILDTQGNVLVSGLTDEQGMYLYTAPVQAAMRIVVNAGLGHQAEYELSAEEWSGNVAIASTQIPEATSSSSPPASNTNPDQNPAGLQRAIAHAIKPLALEIAQLRQRTTLADIIGGIGFIIGILGVIAYWKARALSAHKH